MPSRHSGLPEWAATAAPPEPVARSVCDPRYAFASSEFARSVPGTKIVDALDEAAPRLGGAADASEIPS